MTAAPTLTARPTTGHVDHIVVGYRSRANLDHAQAEFTTQLGVTDWIDLGEDHGQVHAVHSPRGGLKLITPASTDSPLHQRLSDKGEGFVSMCVAVSDIAETVSKAANDGRRAEVIPQPKALVPQTYRSASQVHLGQVGGIELSVGEYEFANPISLSERPRAGTIDHIALAYSSYDGLEAARAELSSVLGIDDWMDAGLVHGLLRVKVSWSTGIELLCPAEPGASVPFTGVRGDGFNCLVFGVADLDAEVKRLGELGQKPIMLPRLPEPVFDTYTVASEAYVGQLGGIAVLLGEFAPK